MILYHGTTLEIVTPQIIKSELGRDLVSLSIQQILKSRLSAGQSEKLRFYPRRKKAY